MSKSIANPKELTLMDYLSIKNSGYKLRNSLDTATLVFPTFKAACKPFYSEEEKKVKERYTSLGFLCETFIRVYNEEDKEFWDCIERVVNELEKNTITNVTKNKKVTNSNKYNNFAIFDNINLWYEGKLHSNFVLNESMFIDYLTEIQPNFMSLEEAVETITVLLSNLEDNKTYVHCQNLAIEILNDLVALQDTNKFETTYLIEIYPGLNYVDFKKIKELIKDRGYEVDFDIPKSYDIDDIDIY